MAEARLLGRIVDFCRAGYPPVGVPPNGFLPLLALLKRRLADDEVPMIGKRCCGSGPPITPSDIRAFIENYLGESPCAGDIARVSKHLADSGWLVVDEHGRTVPADGSDRSEVRTMSSQHTHGPGLVAHLAELAERVESPRIEDVLADVCATVVDAIPGAGLADVMLVREGEVYTLGATSELSADLHALHQRLGEGPCAHGDTAVVRADDLSRESRWPHFAAEAVRLGVRSCLSYKLYSVDRTAATMNVFGFNSHAWHDDAETTGAILAAHAAAAIAASPWGAELTSPLHNRERIGQAKGIIMERYGLDDVSAFMLMKQLADNAGLALLDIAQRVIDTRTR